MAKKNGILSKHTNDGIRKLTHKASQTLGFHSPSPRPIDSDDDGGILTCPLLSRTKSLFQPHSSTSVRLDGQTLKLPTTVSIARRKATVSLAPETEELTRTSVLALEKHLKSGESVYGVNTGFGASANSRTTSAEALQAALLQMQHIGILPADASNRMPSSWVRGAMAIRINSLLRGHSAVRWEVLQQLASFINHRITPIVPLRGSISASGDLSPLSYIAGAVKGHPGIKCVVEETGETITSAEALSRMGLAPINFQPKEVLGLINGTAMSCAAAVEIMHDSAFLGLLTTSLTAMAIEANLGSTESFDPFISSIRPHPGQVEASATIRHLLAGSKLVNKGSVDLKQDRYTLRTASQWIGAPLEDLNLAIAQITTELNSTTDNPLVNPATGGVVHGGNFQALHVTSAMDKARVALQQLGKLTFSQLTETINSSTTPLPPNLTSDDPSLSFTAKGLDVAAASYCSELGFLAAPMTPHVQSAENHNQAVNSLALLSARQTATAVEVSQMLAANHLYILCQALDLRVMTLRFERALSILLAATTSDIFSPVLDASALHTLIADLIPHVRGSLQDKLSLDAPVRFKAVFETAAARVLWFLRQSLELGTAAFGEIAARVDIWRLEMEGRALEAYRGNRRAYFGETAGAELELGAGVRRLYAWVRRELGVGMHKGREDLKSVTGELVGRVYEAIRDGRVNRVLVEMVESDE